MKQARNLIAPLLPIPMIRIAACPAGSSAYHRDSNVRGSSAYPPRLSVNADILFGNPVPCMDGARGAREKNLTFRETIRVQPCIRPLDAAVLAAGPDVIR